MDEYLGSGDDGNGRDMLVVTESLGETAQTSVSSMEFRELEQPLRSGTMARLVAQ